MKSLIALSAYGLVLLLTPAKSFAVNMMTSDFVLSTKAYDAIPIDDVFDDYLPDELAWIFKVRKVNPHLAIHIEAIKVLTIEAKPTDSSDYGSEDPFVLKARQRAAEVGANLLVYESGVVNKNTSRYVSMTFTAYRIEYKKMLVETDAILDLTEIPENNQYFEQTVEEFNSSLQTPNSLP